MPICSALLRRRPHIALVAKQLLSEGRITEWGAFIAKEKILIVDDEPMIRWTLSEALRGWEYDAVEAGTVAGALASFEAERPAAVLLDINLPDGSGLDALREIKKR
jgi:ActR/RegA family two-component response regulator